VLIRKRENQRRKNTGKINNNASRTLVPTKPAGIFYLGFQLLEFYIEIFKRSLRYSNDELLGILYTSIFGSFLDGFSEEKNTWYSTTNTKDTEINVMNNLTCPDDPNARYHNLWDG